MVTQMYLSISSDLWRKLLFLGLVPEFVAKIPPCETGLTSFHIHIPEVKKEQYMLEIRKLLDPIDPNEYSLQFTRKRGIW